MISDARQSPQVPAPPGVRVLDAAIDGMRFYTVTSVPSKSGVVTELWRPEWLGADTRPAHVVHVTMASYAETNWHCHKRQHDLLFVVNGRIRIAFYDDRDGSPTFHHLDLRTFSQSDPTLIAIPPGVWHALQNLDGEPAAFVTMNDQPFSYESPDDWRLPVGDRHLPRPFDA